MSVAKVSRSWPKERWQRITWREGSKGPLTSRFATVRVLPSHGYQHGGPKEQARWLLMEWPEEEEAPTKFWFANLPADTSIPNLIRLAKIRWWIGQGYQQLKDELGLDHYEGRTWQGWHHDVTMTMLAFGFLTLESLHIKKTSGQRWSLPRVRREFQCMLAQWIGICPSCGIIFRWRLDSS